MADRPWAALLVPAELDTPTVADACEALARSNERWLRANPGRVPPLYASGAWYELQPEFWLSIPFAYAAIRSGRGVDCKVLSAWRVAELRAYQGEPASFYVREYDKNGQTLFHVSVARAGGREEDPSALLGMYQALTYGPKEARPWNLLPSPY